jgi:hypothetical protein
VIPACDDCGEKTHERNVLMWIAKGIGMLGLWAVYMFVFFLFAMGFFAGCSSPTAADPVDLHPYETIIVAYTRCFAEFLELGYEPRVGFSNSLPTTRCPDPETGEFIDCPSAGVANIQGRQISYWKDWVRDEKTLDIDRKWVAAHEVCHLAYGASEVIAGACAHNLIDMAGC